VAEGAIDKMRKHKYTETELKKIREKIQDYIIYDGRVIPKYLIDEIELEKFIKYKMSE
jgi:hypothetical protein